MREVGELHQRAKCGEFVVFSDYLSMREVGELHQRATCGEFVVFSDYLSMREVGELHQRLAEKSLYAAQRPVWHLPLFIHHGKELVIYGAKNMCLGQIKSRALYFSLMSVGSERIVILVEFSNWRESQTRYFLITRESDRFGRCGILV
ncbi:hypothetical protein TNCV_280061 [Trichonephila clavipes]|nr:hypothetical protein TNCV_280061 [Trichonephila clavipes]